MAQGRLWLKRLRVLGLAFVMLLASVWLQVAGRHGTREGGLVATRVADSGSRAMELNARIEAALAPTGAQRVFGGGASPEFSALKELLEEHSEALDGLLPALGSAAGSAPVAELLEESREMRGAARALTVGVANGAGEAEVAALASELHAHAVTLSGALREGVASALGALRSELAWGARLLRLGFWVCVASVALVGVALLSVAADVLQEALGPVRLEDELRELAHTPQFQSRMALLSGADDSPREGTWGLRLKRVLTERRTHVSFEAVAVRGDERVPLWGKRYTWTGRLKAFQRLFLPAYEAATWSILCTLHARGLNGPVPVAMRRLRRRRVPVGSILVTEWVGATQSLNVFLGSDFALLDGARRRALVAALGRFVRQLHAADVYRLAPRFFRGTGLDAPAGEAKLYLFDLDKAVLLPGAARWVRHLYRWLDLRRLSRRLRHWCTEAELGAFHDAARASEEAPVSPGAQAT